MVEFSHHITHSLKILTCAIMLSAMSNQVFAATGTVTIAGPNSIIVPPNSSFAVKGTYLLSSDNTPSGSSPAACVFPPGTNIYFNGAYQGNQVPYIRGGRGYTFDHNIHAYAKYLIDNNFNWTMVDLITRDPPSTYTDIGKLSGFQFRVSTKNMPLGSTHSVKVYLEDIHMGICKIAGRWITDVQRGPIFAEKTINFTIGYPTPPTISIALGNTAPTPCEAETGTITVTSNDPTPNGGTVTLTFPNGTTASTSFAGKTATLTFADFGLPNGYSGAWSPGDTLTFTASVTTAAGQTATATATANVIAGGLTVTVNPTKSILSPFINNSRRGVHKPNPQTGIIPAEYKTPVNINVQCGNAPVQGAQVSVAVNILPGSETYGGHDHGAIDGANKPTGTLLPASGSTDIQGMFTTTYQASEFSGQDEITATATYRGMSVTSSPATITIQYPNLVPITLPASSPHSFVGGRCEHYGASTPWDLGKTSACGGMTGNSNQYISTSIANTFYNFLNDYAATYGAGLYINDASLKFGGMFDVNGGWYTGVNHSTHRIGVDVDFALKDTSAPPNTSPLSFPVVWENIVTENYKVKPVIIKNQKTGKVTTIKIITPTISYQQHAVGTANAHVHIFFIK